MIKAGQIYQRSNGAILLITESVDLLHTQISDLYSYIAKTGRTGSIHKSVLLTLTLIAEYPTWQEAVNSPEFKGEKHD